MEWYRTTVHFWLAVAPHSGRDPTRQAFKKWRQRKKDTQEIQTLTGTILASVVWSVLSTGEFSLLGPSAPAHRSAVLVSGWEEGVGISQYTMMLV